MANKNYRGIYLIGDKAKDLINQFYPSPDMRPSYRRSATRQCRKGLLR